jgi:hypothetical protein
MILIVFFSRDPGCHANPQMASDGFPPEFGPEASVVRTFFS